jgi:hypothetical protein
MPANDNGTMTEEQDAAQTALEALRAGSSEGWPITRPAIDDAVRRAARSDLDAQWGPES